MLGDTILAIATPPGAGLRAVLRLSGPQALAAANARFAPILPPRRGQFEGTVRVLDRPVAALALVMPAPHSYTGEDVVELHLPGGPLLCRLLADDLTAAFGTGAVRAALPGEFTRRALTGGRLDLTQAEGLLQLIHGTCEAEARRGLSWLRGGLSTAVQQVRTLLQDALSWLEAGLDFMPEETGAVAVAQWQEPLAQAVSRLQQLVEELPAATCGGEILLLGAANAGKSSLCNALAGREVALVDAAAGTTRDVLQVELAPGIVLWDAPGDRDAPAAVDRDALALRDRLAARAAAALLVVDPGQPVFPATQLPVLGLVWTKHDLGVRPPGEGPAAVQPQFVVSAHSGHGLDALRRFLAAHGRRAGAVAGSATGAALQTALAAARAALDAAPEVAAELRGFDLQQALRALDCIDGRHSPEDLLDRLFGAFCLGK